MRFCIYQIEVFDATNKTIFVIFDEDAKKIVNKSTRYLAKKKKKS